MSTGPTPIGNLWLKQKYGLEHSLTHQSHLGTRPKQEIEEESNIIETYPPTYRVSESALEHIEFGLKYDDLNLDFLRAVFKKLPQEEVVSYINSKPKGSCKWSANTFSISAFPSLLVSSKITNLSLGRGSPGFQCG